MKKITFLTLILMSPLVLAGNTSYSLNNSATVASQCSLRLAEHLNFGNYDPLNFIRVFGTGSIEVACTPGSYRLSANFGNQAERVSGSCERRMKHDSKNVYLGYNLMKDNNHSTNNFYSNVTAGECSNGTVYMGDLVFSANGARTIIQPIYGRAWSLGTGGNTGSPTGPSTAIPGIYVDNLIFTITF